MAHSNFQIMSLSALHISLFLVHTTVFGSFTICMTLTVHELLSIMFNYCHIVEEHPVIYDQIFISDIEVTEPCTNHVSLSEIIGTITSQVNLNLKELCADAVHCLSTLNMHVCKPMDMSSSVMVNFTVNVKPGNSNNRNVPETIETVKVCKIVVAAGTSILCTQCICIPSGRSGQIF